MWSRVAEAIRIPLSNRQRRTEVGDFCDGRELAQSGCYGWLSDGTRLMGGSSFVEAVKIRMGVVSTRERNNRGRPTVTQDLVCDLGCPRVETLGHILQECSVTGQLPILRHNRVAETLKHALTKKNWRAIVEPMIPTEAGIRRPTGENRPITVTRTLCPGSAGRPAYRMSPYPRWFLTGAVTLRPCRTGF